LLGGRRRLPPELLIEPIALVCGFEQLLIALRTTARRTGTPSFAQLVHPLRNGLPQFGKPQTFIVGA
jgi:hypothetical protein